MTNIKLTVKIARSSLIEEKIAEKVHDAVEAYLRKETDRHHDPLARDIVAMLFWRWRSRVRMTNALDRLSMQDDRLRFLSTGKEKQAKNDFKAAYNAYYGKWD